MSSTVITTFKKVVETLRDWQYLSSWTNGDRRLDGDTRLRRDRTDPTNLATMRDPPHSMPMRPYAHWLGTRMTRQQMVAVAPPSLIPAVEQELGVIPSCSQYLDPTKAQVAASPTDWVKLAGYLGGGGEGFSREAVTALGARAAVRSDLNVQLENVYRTLAAEILAASVVEESGGFDAVDGGGNRYWYNPAAVNQAYPLAGILAPNYTPPNQVNPIAPAAPAGAANPGLSAASLYWVTTGVVPQGYPAAPPSYPALGAIEKPDPTTFLVVPDVQSTLSAREVRILAAIMYSTRTLAGRHDAVGAGNAANVVVADNVRPSVQFCSDFSARFA
ncbi:Marginal zone B-and B1-cell-specific protein [Durusdinium trenchii]|uniref:Marginal zone B-and B1-cell-specific protein n=1 Tax=Durusdinium trenchii TaxID=1381693 RepID=A0ABP0NNK9_9DINO